MIVRVTRRPAEEQQLHDRVIEALRARLSGSGRRAYSNPGRERWHAITGHYPDLLLTIATDPQDVACAIYEVETWSSVEERHAEHQWTAFASLGPPLFLVVPEDCADEARRVARELDVDAEIVSYRETPRGAIKFSGNLVPPEATVSDHEARLELLHAKAQEIDAVARYAVASGQALDDTVVFVIHVDDRLGRSLAQTLVAAAGSDLERALARVPRDKARIMTTVLTREQARVLVSGIQGGEQDLATALWRALPPGAFTVVVVCATGALVAVRELPSAPVGEA
jgi:hypothetical protein